MDDTTFIDHSDTEISKKSQQGCREKMEFPKEGGFSAVPHEMSEFLANPPIKITMEENRIIWFLIRELQGYQMRFKILEIDRFVKGTGLEKHNLFHSLKSLVQKGIIKKAKAPGIRAHLWGFEEDLFGKVLCAKNERTTQEHCAKVVDLTTFKVVHSTTLKVVDPTTKKDRKQAPVEAIGASKHIKTYRNIEISQREILEFFSSQKSLSSRRRWEKRVSEILKTHPEDGDLLWFAIETIHRTGKDLHGVKIHSSIIGLFENTDWGIMRATLLAMMNQIKDKEDREKRRQENVRLVEATRKRLQEEVDHPKVIQFERK